VQPSRADVASLSPTCWSAAVAPASVAGVASELRLRRFNLRDPSAAAAVCSGNDERLKDNQPVVNPSTDTTSLTCQDVKVCL
jgi:hypothetical protein